MKKCARFTLRLTPELRARLNACAKHQDRTPSWLASKYIEQGLDRDTRRNLKPKRT